jgi:putative acetyltransferase
VFVRAAFQGQGIGRQLCEALIEHAASAGYRAMRLDTGQRNDEALALYASLGFISRDAYAYYPPDLEPQLHFMERPLASPASGVEQS